MPLRDQLEQVLRAWNEHELPRSAPAVIDFDCHPQSRPADLKPADRLTTYRALTGLRGQPEAMDDPRLAQRIGAHLLYLRALMGERPELEDYIRGTQGCHARGWPESYIRDIGAVARGQLSDIGVSWSAGTRGELRRIELPIDVHEAPAAIQEAAAAYEAQVGQLTGSAAPYSLGIETTSVNAYRAYWTDGTGEQVRLRLNLKEARFTEVQARQFALHEVLGHGLQGASSAQRCASEAVPRVRLLSLHTAQQVLLEGLGQTLPLFVAPDDKLLATRVRIDHYTQLVRAHLHINPRHRDHHQRMRRLRTPARPLLDRRRHRSTSSPTAATTPCQVIANFKTWRIMHTDCRRPLETFASTISAVIALHFYAAA